MSTLKKSFCIFILFLSTGCLETKKGSRHPFPGTTEGTVIAACAEIKNIGDIQSLLYKVHANTKEILNLSELPQPTKNLARITILGDEIEMTVEKIKALTKAEWTNTTLDLKTQWTLRPTDFLSTNELDGIITYDRIKIRTVVANGKEQEALLKQTHFTVDTRSNIIITLNKKASILETCELMDTIGIIVEVRYQVFGRYENPVPTVGYKTFQLVLDAKD